MSRKSMKIEAVLEGLHREGWMGWTHLRMWREIRNYLESHPDLHQQGPAFFHFALVAHLDAAVLHLARLLDDQREAAGLEYLFNLAEASPQAFGRATEDEVRARVREDRQALGALRARAAAVKAVRDKKLAHLDRKHFTDPAALAGLFDIRPEEIESLYRDVSEVANAYQGLHTDEEVFWELLGWEDCRWILELCERGYLEGEKDIERLRGDEVQ